MLELKNVTVAVGEDGEPAEVVSDVSLKLEKKKIYVMTGPNGGGKSSLATLELIVVKAPAPCSK